MARITHGEEMHRDAVDLSSHTGDPTDAHDASAISVADTAAKFTATDVEAALEELFDSIGATGHSTHDAVDVDFTPAGTIAATDTQAAVEEVAVDAAADLAGHTGDTSDAHDASAVSIADAGAYFIGGDVEAALQELGAAGGGGGGSDRLISRTQSLVQDDCFLFATTNVYDGGVVQQVSGTGASTSLPSGSGIFIGHPGIIQLSTGTTATGRCALAGQAAYINLGQDALGGGPVRFGAVIFIPALSAAAQRFVLRSGLGDVLTGDSVDGVYFRYTDDVNSGQWEAVACSNSTETAIDTGVAGDTNWHTYEFEVNADGSNVEFFIDGVSVGSITTNIPTGFTRQTGLMPLAMNKTVGTTARTSWIDAYWYHFDLSR